MAPPHRPKSNSSGMAALCPKGAATFLPDGGPAFHTRLRPRAVQRTGVKCGSSPKQPCARANGRSGSKPDHLLSDEMSPSTRCGHGPRGVHWSSRSIPQRSWVIFRITLRSFGPRGGTTRDFAPSTGSPAHRLGRSKGLGRGPCAAISTATDDAAAGVGLKTSVARP